MDALHQSFLAGNVPVRRIDYRNTYHRRLRSIGSWLDRSAHQRLQRAFDASGADIIHLNQQCLEDGFDLLIAARTCCIPVVSTIHVTRTAQSLGARGAVLRDRLARHVLCRSRVPLIGVSPNSSHGLECFVRGRNRTQTKTTAVELLQVPRIFSVSNGVPEPHLADRVSIRKSLGLLPEHIILGVIARIEDQKNPLFMCRLLRELPENVRCVWVGDGRLREQLEKEIQSSGLDDRFILTGWQDQASRYLSAFDCFCLPSKYEGLPLALLEAMAASLPAVVSHVDGTEDAVHHGQTGFLCRVDDVHDWLLTLTTLIASAELRTSIGGNARERFESEFSLEAMTNRTLAVYGQVIRDFSGTRQPSSN